MTEEGAVSPESTRSAWTLLRPEDLPALPDTRLEVHYGVQLLASFGQAMVPSRSDDSHRSMRWDAMLPGFRSETSGTGELDVSLHVPTFSLEVRRSRTVVSTVPLSGARPGNARDRLQEILRNATGQSVDLAWPEYDLPARDGSWDRALTPDAGALKTLAAWFGNAALVLAALTMDVRQASPVRCWPHHFDIASLLTFPREAEADPAHVGLGLSPGDAPGDLPYFYVNGWPAPDPSDLTPLPPPARWNTDGWVGAVLAAADVAAPGDVAAQRTRVEDFFQTARAAMVAVQDAADSSA